MDKESLSQNKQTNKHYQQKKNQNHPKNAPEIPYGSADHKNLTGKYLLLNIKHLLNIILFLIFYFLSLFFFFFWNWPSF